MEILYVIGNGFDLWHELPARYTDFYKFSKCELDELEQYLISDAGSDNPWSNFESYLGKFDWRRFYDSHNEIDVLDESFKPSMAYCLKDDLREQADNLVYSITSKFQAWIDSVAIDDASKKFNFNSKGLFLSFNYTSLLQIVYGINDDRVIHIHGSARRYERLIFGHGESMEEEPELDKNGDSSRTMFTDAEGAAKYPFHAFQKPVVDILDNNFDFFESLKNVKDVYVIGHSLNDIDLPYFKNISDMAQDSNWIVSKYSEGERENHIEQLKKCGVSLDRIRLCSIDDISTYM